MAKRSWALVAIAAAGLTACGGGTASGSSTTAVVGTAAGASTTVAGAASLQAYEDCMKEHGVEFGQGGFGAGGGGGGRRGAATSDTTGQPAAATTVPANGGARPSFDQSAFQAANEACASLRPVNGNGAGGNGANGGANNTAIQAYLSCLKDNGVTVPDPTANGATRGTAQGAPNSDSGNGPRGNGPGGGFLGGIDRTSPAFEAANAKCQVLLPQGAGGVAGSNGSITNGANSPNAPAAPLTPAPATTVK